MVIFGTDYGMHETTRSNSINMGMVITFNSDITTYYFLLPSVFFSISNFFNMNNNNNNKNPLSSIRDVNVSKLIQLYNNDMYLNNTFFKIVTCLLKKRPVEGNI